MTEENKFYYQGKYFTNEDDFFAYIKEFTLKQTTEEDFNRLFEMLKKDIWLNLQMRETKVINGELRSIFEDTFYFVMQKIWKRKIDDN